MGDNPTPEGATQVKVSYLQLNENERKVADAVIEETKTFLVSGFRDTLVKERERWEKETDPRTRPGFSGSDPKGDETLEVDIKRFDSVRRAVVSKATGQTVGWVAPATASMQPDQALGETKGGWLPPVQMDPDSRRQMATEFATYVKELGDTKSPSGVPFSVLKFPRGDIENFSIARWAMAVERSQNTAEGTAAFAKWAPWEAAYYAALEGYANSKAQGDMVSGQDGGFLAPELWSTSFIDQIYPASALSRLPITRVPMGNRVVHVPRLSANIQVSN